MTTQEQIDLAAPLEGLIKQPAESQTEEQLRAQVNYLRTLRTSSQTFQAEVRGKNKQENEAKESKAFDGF